MDWRYSGERKGQNRSIFGKIRAIGDTMGKAEKENDATGMHTIGRRWVKNRHLVSWLDLGLHILMIDNMG